MYIQLYLLFWVITIIVIVLSIVLTAKRGNLSTINVKDDEVIVHFTTTKNRINSDFIQEVIKSYLKIPQVSEIIISVHKDKDSHKNVLSELNKIDNLKGVTMNYIEKDYGPATKFLGLFHMPDEFKTKYCFGKNTLKNKYFFVCDDDIIFKPDLIDNMLTVAHKNARADVISNNIYGKFVTYYRGYSGNLIRPSFFKNVLLEMEMPESCSKIDDQWIQVYMNYFKIRVETTNFGLINKIIEQDYGKNNGLHTQDNRNKLIESCWTDMSVYYNDLPTFW